MKKPLILFVHGLGADALATWGQFDSLIKNDTELGSRIDTAFFSYPTRLWRWWPFTRSLKIQEISRALKTEIDRRFNGYDRILLVCHSLGGLVAKHYVCDAIKQKTRQRVQGVIFFATPHSGAALAGIGAVISLRHLHLRQLRPESDFIDLISADWTTLKCESALDVTYVAGGQDAIVNQNSAGPPGASVELISQKGHLNIVKPEGDSDLSYLIVKQTASKLFFDNEGDVFHARRAIDSRDSYSLAALVANRGRSWIETVQIDEAVAVLQDIVTRCPADSTEAVWSRYLLALARLFQYGETSSTAFSDDLVRYADAIDLAPLFLGERMEFARKRGDRHETLRAASVLREKIRGIQIATNSGSAYAVGTAHFLLGNLYRYGGRYQDGRQAISQARLFFRPSILAHQIELAHCDYASAISRAMEGSLTGDDVVSLPPSREFRRFADALITLTKSHAAWSMLRLGEAMAHAERASEAFDQIRFTNYAKRARSLGDLLGAWRRLELGAIPNKAIAHTPEHATLIRGMMGDGTAYGTLKSWMSRTRPSQVLGLLQFASAYSEDWTADIGEFSLPPILQVTEDNLEWLTPVSSSLRDADAKLRELMGIGSEVRVPLIAD